MPTATVETPTPAVHSTVGEKAADVIRSVTDAGHEARLLKSLATDAVEDGVYAARRAARTAKRDLEDVRDELAYRVKRTPLKALTFAAVAGIGFGILLGAVMGRCTVKTNARG